MVWDSSVPEHDDKIDSVNFYKDNFLFLKSFGPQKYQRFPVKGIDSQETEVGPLMDYVVITNYIVGANNETAGGYSCQVDYLDYHGNPDQSFPVKGVDPQETEVELFRDYVVITSIVGANNETAGGHEMAWDSSVPDQFDKIVLVNFYKDNFLFLKSFGPRKYERFPVKGIDSQETEVGLLMDYVVITNYIVGANNETAGGYSCQVDYIDYYGNPDERYPVKGIDAQETEVGPLMDYVVITNYIAGATNESAGGNLN
ncbi:unnamed protein product [Oppiella nova]|uniref:Uncharacterized protein n=1 Tax=Oppiella nova TaxID=334625 RepID=A0A7R9LS07_9ACAR|nr:unnamed protein product [Oppiella nova]CAG2166402.1 unnamed protein product [Oppiella nova]